MINKLLNRFIEAGMKKLKTADLPILEIILDEGKMKQYSLEKALKKRKKGLQHSSVTSKLKKMVEGAYLNRYEESDGYKYYEITPIGLAYLIAKGKIPISRAITYFQDRPMLYYETLARLQPNLKDMLEKIPPFFVDQVTEDLWIFYWIRRRLDLRRTTLEFLVNMRTKEEYESEATNQIIQFLCVNRIDIKGEGVCVKQRQRCPYSPKEIFDCPIIRKQVLKEIERLRKMKQKKREKG